MKQQQSSRRSSAMLRSQQTCVEDNCEVESRSVCETAMGGGSVLDGNLGPENLGLLIKV